MQSELRLTGIQTFTSLVMKIILETDNPKIETKNDMSNSFITLYLPRYDSSRKIKRIQQFTKIQRIIFLCLHHCFYL